MLDVDRFHEVAIVKADERSDARDDGAASDVNPRYKRRRFFSRRTPTIVGASILALTIVVAAVVLRPNRSTDVASTSVSSTPTPPRATNTEVYDRFTRDTVSSLGRAETGQEWSVSGAEWRISEGEAQIASADAGHRSAALITTSSDVIVQVTITRVAAGAGVTFRYRDAFNYWALTAAPKSGTWSLQKVVGSNAKTLGTLGTTGATDGTIVAVRLQSQHIEVLINGVPVKAIDDGDLSDVHRVGLIGIADDDRSARWDNLVVSRSPTS